MKSNKRLMGWLAGGIFVSVLLIMGVVIWREQDALLTFPWHFSPGYLALTVIFHSLALGITFVVWHLMIKRMGDFSDLRFNFRIYYLSSLAKRIPLSIWYIGGRIVMYEQIGVSVPEVANCILLENIMIGIAGVIILLVFLPFYPQFPGQFLLPVAIVGIAGLLVLLNRPQVLVEVTNRILRRFGKQELDRAPRRKDVFVWCGLYIFPWFFAGLALYCATRAFSDGPSPNLPEAIIVSTLAMLVALLSTILPGGLGLKELTSSALLAYWMPFTSALVISVAYRLIQTINEILWVVLSTLLTSERGQLADTAAFLGEKKLRKAKFVSD